MNSTQSQLVSVALEMPQMNFLDLPDDVLHLIARELTFVGLFKPRYGIDEFGNYGRRSKYFYKRIQLAQRKSKVPCNA